MTREEIVEGLKLLEDNMVHFDEIQNDKGEWIDVHELLFETIEALSQEQNSGKWIDINGIYAECSNCNEEIYITGDFKYCPNCGAKMEGSGKE